MLTPLSRTCSSVSEKMAVLVALFLNLFCYLSLSLSLLLPSLPFLSPSTSK